MRDIAPRPISGDELAVVRQALSVALKRDSLQIPDEALENLTVVAECECGCRSVAFECGAGVDQQIADGVGVLASGDHIDVVVWGRNSEIASLEFVDHLGIAELPIKVISWEAAGNAS